MFSSPSPGLLGNAPQFARAYRQIAVQTGVDSASPHQLVTLLFDGFLESLAHAKGAIAGGRIEDKCQAIGRAARIVEEGLRAGLDRRAGGRLAQGLHDLYGWVCLRLTQANLRNDPRLLDECRQLMQPLRDAWVAIGPGPHPAAGH